MKLVQAVGHVHPAALRMYDDTDFYPAQKPKLCTKVGTW